MTKTNKQILATNSGIVIVSMLFFLSLVEIILRLNNFNPFGEFFKNEGRAIFIQPSQNPQRIYEAKPNAQGYGWETEISINSHGFRGKEYSLAKPENTQRIAIIGDSITFGNRLTPDENYPAVLESLYRQKNNFGNKKTEVLNLGLGGYDTLQAVATLESIGLAFKPDVVVLGFCINDIGVASGNAKYVKRLQQYGSPIYRLRIAQFIQTHLDRIALSAANQKANQKESFSERYKNYMVEASEIKSDKALNQLVENLKTTLLKTENKNTTPFTWGYTQAVKLQRLRFALKQLKSLQYKNSSQNNKKQFEVVILVFPFLLEGAHNQDSLKKVYQIVEHEAQRLDFKTVNLYPLFLTAGFENLLIKDNDGIHPNALGHRLTAEALLELIPYK